ncbi:MAG: 8-oxoguanine deaminase, partial [Leptothrix ochracea]
MTPTPHVPTLLIHHATLIATMDEQRREVRDGSVLIRGGVIAAVGPAAEVAGMAQQWVGEVDEV